MYSELFPRHVGVQQRSNDVCLNIDLFKQLYSAQKFTITLKQIVFHLSFIHFKYIAAGWAILQNKVLYGSPSWIGGHLNPIVILFLYK